MYPYTPLSNINHLKLFFKSACLLIASVSAVSAADSEAGRVLLKSATGDVRTFERVQAAVDNARPGDIIELKGGVYHESIHFKRSGEPGRPIILRGNGEANAVLDGAYQSLQILDEQVWQPYEFEGTKMYRAVLPFAGEPSIFAIGTWISRYGVRGSNGCDQLIATYASLAALKNGVRGVGSFRRGSEVFLCLNEGEDPNKIPLSIGSSVAVLDLGNQSSIRIENLEVRNGGWAGIRLGNSASAEVLGLEELDRADLAAGVDYSDIVISNVTIRNCFRGISAGSLRGANVIIEDVVVANGIEDSWPWAGGYTSGVGAAAGNNSDDLAPWRGFGIRLVNLTKSEVRNSVVSGQWDGMGLKKCYDVNIYNCTLRNLMDDAIELESLDQSEIQFHNNHLYNVFAGVSVTANTPGPIYVYRNVVEVTRPGGRGFAASYGIKSGHDNYGHADNIKFYHNTFFSRSYSIWEKYGDPAPNRWNGYDFINNVFYVYREGQDNYNFRGVSKSESGVENHWEGNVYNRSRPKEEKLSITDENLGAYFVNTDTQTPEEARDLRIRFDQVEWPSGSTYAIEQGWPDKDRSATGAIERGAWGQHMGADAIGAGTLVLKRIDSDN